MNDKIEIRIMLLCSIAMMLHGFISTFLFGLEDQRNLLMFVWMVPVFIVAYHQSREMMGLKDG